MLQHVPPGLQDSIGAIMEEFFGNRHSASALSEKKEKEEVQIKVMRMTQNSAKELTGHGNNLFPHQGD